MLKDLEKYKYELSQIQEKYDLDIFDVLNEMINPFKVSLALMDYIDKTEDAHTLIDVYDYVQEQTTFNDDFIYKIKELDKSNTLYPITKDIFKLYLLLPRMKEYIFENYKFIVTDIYFDVMQCIGSRDDSYEE